MVFFCNQMGHDTEEAARSAASATFVGIAAASEMLAAAEIDDVEACEARRAAALQAFEQAGYAYDDIAQKSSEIPLSIVSPESTSGPLFEGILAMAQLRSLGIEAPARLNDVPSAAAAQIRLLADVVKNVQFKSTHADWYAGAQVVQEVARTLEMGVALSRLASLTGADPDLAN